MSDDLQSLAHRIRLLLDTRGRPAETLSNYRGGNDLRSHNFYFRSGRDGSIYVNDLAERAACTILTQKTPGADVELPYAAYSFERLMKVVGALTVLEALSDV